MRAWWKYVAALVVATIVITAIVVATSSPPLIGLVGLPVGVLIAVWWMPTYRRE